MRITLCYLLFAFVLTSIVVFGAVNSTMGHLKEQEEWQETEELKNPFENDPEAIGRGEKAYRKACAQCHGSSGKGDGVAAVALDPRPTDLTSEEFQSQSDGTIFAEIKKGQGDMPSFDKKLTDKQIWELVSFVRQFKKKESAAK